MRLIRNRFSFVVLLMLISVLAACTFTAPGQNQAEAPTPELPSEEYTAAAETIIAQLTEAAVTLTPESGGSGTPAGGTPVEGTSPAEPVETEAQPTETQVAPTETLTPTSAASPTPVASPTATISADDPKASLGDADFSDNFSSAANWPLYQDDHVAFAVDTDADELVMTGFNADKWDGWMLTWPIVEDDYVEASGEFQKCSGLDRWGLVVRSVKNDDGIYVGYLFGVSCDGRYSLRSWDGDKFTRVIDWTEDEAINGGSNQSNLLGVLADGESLALYANGELLAEVSDSAHTEPGRFGLSVGSAETLDFKVRVSEIDMWELP